VDWIEKVFHVSPDGGSGVVEVLIYVVLATITVLGIDRWLGRGTIRRSGRNALHRFTETRHVSAVFTALVVKRKALQVRDHGNIT
jgi:hypothetical protein